MHAIMSFSLGHMAGYSDEEMEEVILHELMHCVLDEAAGAHRKDKGSLERVTTSLARTLQRVRTRQPKPFARPRRKVTNAAN